MRALCLASVILWLTPLPTPAVARDYWPTDGWRTARPAEHGLTDEGLSRLEALNRGDRHARAMLIVAGGYLVAEWHYEGATPEAAQSLGELTGWITATLTGVAIHRGRLEGIDQPAADHFVRWRGSDEPRARITVEHLLSRTAGLAWEATDAARLARAVDRVGFALGQPVRHPAGARFRGTPLEPTLLSGLIGRATEQTLAQFAARELFEPLGIRRATWTADAHGTTRGDTGLSMTPRELARVALLLRDRGRWGDRHLVSPEYVALAGRPIAAARNRGFFCQLARTAPLGPVQIAGGRTGRVVLIAPTHDLILVRLGRRNPRPKLVRQLMTALGRARTP